MDDSLRELERAWRVSPDDESLRQRLFAARKRAGIELHVGDRVLVSCERGPSGRGLVIQLDEKTRDVLVRHSPEVEWKLPAGYHRERQEDKLRFFMGEWWHYELEVLPDPSAQPLVVRSTADWEEGGTVEPYPGDDREDDDRERAVQGIVDAASQRGEVEPPMIEFTAIHPGDRSRDRESAAATALIREIENVRRDTFNAIMRSGRNRDEETP